MILRWLPLTLFVAVLTPGLLRAQQQPSGVQGSQQPTNGTGIGDSPRLSYGQFAPSAGNAKVLVHHYKMYEDIEIMRRILGRKLQPLYPRVSVPNLMSNPYTSTVLNSPEYPVVLPTNTAVNPNTAVNLTSPYTYNTLTTGALNLTNQYTNTVSSLLPLLNATQIGVPNTYIFSSPPYKEETQPTLEGVYLLGQGVVFTATLSSLQLPAKAEADSAAKLLVEAIVQQNSEWESLRKQIRNEKEKPKKPEASKPPSLSGVLLKVLAENGHHFSLLPENESLTLVLTVHDTNPSSTATNSETKSAKTESSTVLGDHFSSELRDKVRDLELLVELHLKQGKYGEAITELRKAMEMTKSPKRQVELCRKLAQCYLMRQDPADFKNARAVLEEAIQLTEKESEAKPKPAPAAKPVAALPVKLIISAPKKLLDQVKEGKITFEEFRRQASVETLRFVDRR
ncbi:MAG TPA: tetratricopeptide repeat protein [Gemmataceae bacterium]|nr:tetratricopeptide repeat protein [Gemmataceae bacterium]